jgi:hypothetical protein
VIFGVGVDIRDGECMWNLQEWWWGLFFAVVAVVSVFVSVAVSVVMLVVVVVVVVVSVADLPL